MDKKQKKIINLIVKICVTCLGLFLVFRKVDFSALQLEFTGRTLLYFSLAFLFSLIAEYFACSRTKAVSGADFSIWKFYRINLIGRFFNLFLPTSIGGDVMRAAKLGSYTHSHAKSAVTVFVDRLTGITIIAIFSSFTSIVVTMTGIYDIPAIGMLVIAILTVLVSSTWVVIYSPPLLKVVENLVAIIPIKKLKDFLSDVLKSLGEVRSFGKNRLLMAFFYSILVQLLSSVVIHCINMMLRIPGVTFFHVVLIRAITDGFLLVPVSINGLGLRDYIFKSLYETITNAPNIVLVALVQFMVQLIQGLIGAVLYLVDSKTNNEQHNA